MLKLDAIDSLALTVHTSPGVYALLLGSGVSRAAGIPTGWEVTTDLAKRLATLQGADVGDDAASWYRKTLGVEPSYSEVLAAVAKSPAERQRVLRTYFEPTEDEREQKLKVPTDAHRAIADLCASGLIRVIVTTNFDRLVEQALEERGLHPTVISTADSAEGAPPLVHSNCVVVKLHGDYRDARILNTPEELDQYDARVDQLLDRILDDFGLIVCGWSGEWDTALRRALERRKSRRFSTYWVARRELVGAAADLVRHLGAVPVIHQDADAFFATLAGKIEALNDLARPHPLSAPMAVAAIKRSIPNPTQRINVYDLVRSEAARAFEAINDPSVSAPDGPPRDEPYVAELRRRVAEYEGRTEILRFMLAAGVHWDDECRFAPLWIETLELFANPKAPQAGNTYTELAKYPAFLLLYAVGLALFAANRFGTLRTVLMEPTCRGLNGKTPIVLGINPWTVLRYEQARVLYEKRNRPMALHDHMHDVLRDTAREIVPLDERYSDLFDSFEYFISLVQADLKTDKEAHPYGPGGRFIWRAFASLSNDDSVVDTLSKSVLEQGDSHPILKAGFFRGSPDRFRDIAKASNEVFQSWARQSF